MYDRPFQETGAGFGPDTGPYQTPYRGRTGCHGRGMVRTAVMWAAIAVVAMLAFGIVTWAFGVVLGLAVLLLKIALVTAVVAFVWRRVTRRHGSKYDA